MSGHTLSGVLLSPIISEKATITADETNTHVFKVAMTSNKLQIKRAIEEYFGVKVEKVATCIMKTRPKRHRNHTGRAKRWKKAYVTLVEGHDIDFLTIE